MKDKMRYVKLSDIQVGGRFREDFGDLDTLMESISEKGIVQPITVSSNMELLAGGRRYAACKKLELKEIPALIREVEGELDAREIELIENLHRKDFTWQEQAKLTSRIHALYMEKDPRWSMRKTAEAIDKGAITISRAERLSNALEEIPEISECKTAEEALKFIKKKEEAVLLEELVRRQKEMQSKVSSGERAFINRADKDYIIGDCLEGMRKLHLKDKVCFIECDPPYGIGLNNNGGDWNELDSYEKREKYASYREIPGREYETFLKKLAVGTYEAAGKNCWMVFWFSMQWYPEVLSSLEEAGWLVDRVPAIWIKNRSKSMYPEILTRGYDTCLICRKGEPIILKVGHSNVFYWSPEEKPYHPTQRPVKLLEDMLDIFAPPASYVLVPFAGSGATLRACYKKGLFCLGFDVNKEYKNNFLEKIGEDAVAASKVEV